MKSTYRGRKYREDEYVLCPWYMNESVTEIRCQGLCSKISTQVFKSNKKKTEYKEDFCMGLWKNCEQSIALTNKEEYESECDKKAGQK